MADCIFCKIAKKEIPSDIVYEDKFTLAFLDRSPVNKGHTLVIPKEHSENLLDTSEENLSYTIKTVKKVAKAIMKATGAKGFNVNVNNFKDAGQVVFHSHFHIVPRFPNDGFRLWSGGKKYKEGEDKQIAEKIKTLLK